MVITGNSASEQTPGNYGDHRNSQSQQQIRSERGDSDDEDSGLKGKWGSEESTHGGHPLRDLSGLGRGQFVGSNGRIMDGDEDGDGDKSMRSMDDEASDPKLVVFGGMAENQELDEPLEDQLSYLKATRSTPAQTKFLEELSITTERLNALLEKTETVGLSLLQQKEYKLLAAQELEFQKKLKRLEGNRKRSQEYRQREKERLSEVAQAFPEVADQLNRMNRNKRGRSRLEEDYPELQQAIMEITGNSGSEQTANMTLKQLTEELRRRGINVSSTAVYCRLMPRLLGSSEAKRHVSTVPVKLRSYEHCKHPGTKGGKAKQHDDRAFAENAIGYLKEEVEEDNASRDGVSVERRERPHLSSPPIPPPATHISPQRQESFRT